MRKDVDGHLTREALEIGDMRLHVLVRRHVRKSPCESINELSVRQPDGVERPEPVGEAGDEIVGQFTPERVMPAKLTTAKHVVPRELVEVRTYLVHRTHGTLHVRRDMIADTRPHTSLGSDRDHFL